MESNGPYSNSNENNSEMNSISSKESLKLGIDSKNRKNEIAQNKLGDNEQIKFFNQDSFKKNKNRMTPNIIPYVKKASSKHMIRHKNTIFEKAISQTNKIKKKQTNFKEILYNYVSSTKQIPVRNFEYKIEGEPVKIKSEKECGDIFTLKKKSEDEIEESSSSSSSSSDSSSDSESKYNKKSHSLGHSIQSSHIVSESSESKKISGNNKHVTINIDKNYYYEFKKNNFNILKNFGSKDKDAFYINDNANPKRPSVFSNISNTGTTKANTRCSFASSVQSVQTNNNNQKFLVNKSSKSNLVSQITNTPVTKFNKETNNTINALNLISKLKNLNLSLAHEKDYGKYFNDLSIKTKSVKKSFQNRTNMKFDRRTSAIFNVKYSGISQKKDLHSKTHVSSFFAKLKHKNSM